MNFIQGEKFKKLADGNKIFYCHTHEVNKFFSEIDLKNNFILISHNSDGAVEYNASRWDGASFSKAPENLIKWFAQNVNYENEKLQSLPIGLENSEWFVELKKIEKIKNIKNTEKNIKNIVYLNVNIQNNINERSMIYDILKSKKYATVEYGKNGNNYDNYISNVYNHCFMVCPAGNGIDVHQPWESMYIDTIPIQKKCINNKFYSDLPICFIDEWEQLEDEQFLLKEYIRLKSKKHNLEKINFNYWENLILKEAEKI